MRPERRRDDSPPFPMPVAFDDSALRPCVAEFMWCVHCERAFQYGQAREQPGKPACPYVGCEKSRAEPWDWVRVQRLNPDYPRLPTHGVVYPLFGRGTYVRG